MQQEDLPKKESTITSGSRISSSLFKFLALTIILIVTSILLKDPISDYISTIRKSSEREQSFQQQSQTETKTISEYITEFKEGEVAAYTPSIQVGGKVRRKESTPIHTTGEGEWVSVSGSTMTGDLVMSSSNINIDGNNLVTSENIITSSQLDILAGGIYLSELTGTIGDDQIEEGAVDLDTNEVAGILPIRKGGTNAGTFGTNAFIWYNGTRLTSTSYSTTSFMSPSLDNWVNTSGDNMSGNLTMSGGANIILSGSGNLLFGGTYLNEITGSSDSGAYVVGVYDEFGNSNSTKVQDVLDDLDQAITDLGVLGVSPDSLDFSEFLDSMNLDATTTIVFGANNYTLNLNNTGDLVIQDNGTPFAYFADGGYFDIDSLRLDSNTLSSTSGGITLTASNSNIVLSSQADAAGEAVRADRSVSAGNGLSGGGDLTADRSLSVNQAFDFAWTGNNSWGTGSATFNNRPAFNGGDASNSPFTVDSNYIVSLLNTDVLDGQEGAFYQNASNINAGILGNGYFSAYPDLTAEGYLNNDAGTDLLTRDQSDARFLIFTTFNAPSGTSPVADLYNDTVNFAEGSNITITGNETTDTLTFAVNPTGLNADTLDTLDSASFLRSDADDSYSGGNTLTFDGATDFNGNVTISDQAIVLDAASFSALDLTGDLQLWATGDDDDFIYFQTASNIPYIYFEQGNLNDAGFRVNTTALEYRDEGGAWTAINSIGGGYWQLSTNVLNPSLATYDFAIGGIAVDSSMFGLDEDQGNFYFGYDNSANPTFLFEATGGQAGTFGFNTSDAFYFTVANVGVGTTAPTDFTLQVNGSIGPSSAPSPSSQSLTVSTIDSTDNVGYDTSIAIGTDGLPVISHSDNSNYDLRVCKCSNSSCTSASCLAVDSADAGAYTSITIGTDGFPVISYFGIGLKVAKCGNTSCSSGNTISTVVSDNGYSTSIAIGADGLPVIAYGNSTNGDLKVAKCNDAACTGGDETISIVLAAEMYGGPSLKIGTDGLPVIAYTDLNNYLEVVKCGNPSCSSGNTFSTVDSTCNVEKYSVPLAIGTDGLPVIAYRDYAPNMDLKVAKCGNTYCSSGNTLTTIDSTNDVGGMPSMAIGTDGLPIISHNAGISSNLRMCKCSNAICTSATCTTLAPTTGYLYSSTTIGSDGLPIISHLFSPGGDLEVVKCGSPSCGYTPGYYWSGGSDIGSRGKFFNNVYATTYWAKEDMQISNFDLAEDYKTVDTSVSAGDVVATAPDSEISIDKTKLPYQNNVIGVVSTKPGIKFTDWDLPENEIDQMRPVALAGRVPVKVTTENGPILKGDFLVPSSKPGYAMKACGDKYCQAGTVIGKALEDFLSDQSGSSSLVQENFANELQAFSLDPSAYGNGLIMMFVNLSWYIPPNLLTNSSNLDHSNDLYTTLWTGNLDTINNLSVTNEITAEAGVFKQISADNIEVKDLYVIGLLTSRKIKTGVLSAYEEEDIIVRLSESLGQTAFKIENSMGEVVFSVDSEGKVGGEGVFENAWVPLSPYSKLILEHNFGTIPRDISISKSVNSLGLDTTSVGYGLTNGYYYEDLNENTITIVNGSRKKIYVKVFLRK